MTFTVFGLGLCNFITIICWSGRRHRFSISKGISPIAHRHSGTDTLVLGHCSTTFQNTHYTSYFLILFLPSHKTLLTFAISLQIPSYAVTLLLPLIEINHMQGTWSFNGNLQQKCPHLPQYSHSHSHNITTTMNLLSISPFHPFPFKKKKRDYNGVVHIRF